jgi:glycyl-tRNA synthetase beta chain
MVVAAQRMKGPGPVQGRHPPMVAAFAAGLVDFILDRLRAQLRAEGARHDLVAASIGGDDDLSRILARAEALRGLVESPDGANLLAAYKRAANILRIEEKKDGPHGGPVDPDSARTARGSCAERRAGSRAARGAGPPRRRGFRRLHDALATLRAPLDSFFDKVVVNAEAPALRANRLRLLARLRAATDAVADLSKIEA